MLVRICTTFFYVSVTLMPTYVTCIFFPRYMRLKGMSSKPHMEEIENYPHRVAIVDNENLFVCAATIIGDVWALTSAQCVYNKQNITIRAGSSCWAFRGTLHNVTNIIIHPQYFFTEPPNATYYNDLAVLKVNKVFDEMKKASPIKISSKEPTDGNQGVLSNWGRLKKSEGHYQWGNLVIIDADTINRRVCKKRIPELTRGMICYREKSINIFPPDRGSAYEVHGRLAGVMSFGREPYKSKSFNVVTNVLFYRLWIMSAMSRCRKASKHLPGTQLVEENHDYPAEYYIRNISVPQRNTNQSTDTLQSTANPQSTNTTRSTFLEYMKQFGYTFIPNSSMVNF